MHYRITMLKDGLYHYEAWDHDPRSRPDAQRGSASSSTIEGLALLVERGTTIEWVGDVKEPPEFEGLRREARRTGKVPQPAHRLP